MVISILGGAGFVGSSLANKLSESGTRFKILDKQISPLFPSETEVVDIRNRTLLAKHIGSDDIIINLAAEHRDDVRPKSLYDEVNVGGARNVCRAAEEKGIRTIVFTSSVAVYGFAEANTGENGDANYFNDYGRTKYEAELIYKKWQLADPENRVLVIVRPTVIFGEGNRGNVYNLFKQVASGQFIMFGSGKNCKSLAYVENVVAFIRYTLSFRPGVHIYNYVDKPDCDMNELITRIRAVLFSKTGVGIRLPAFLGVLIGHVADFLAKFFRLKLPISAIRVKKFMGTTQFSSAIPTLDFEPPVDLMEALDRTLRYEFLEQNKTGPAFETE